MSGQRGGRAGEYQIVAQTDGGLSEFEPSASDANEESVRNVMEIDPVNHRYPYCIVWVPIPMITWFFPFVGHMGIATSRGVVRDFAGSYYVSEDEMGFGWPIRVWQLDPSRAELGGEGFDRAISEASDEYKTRMHNLICDNCHSHVAMALNRMKYGGKADWNMVKLAALILFKGKYITWSGFLQQWLPLLLLVGIVLVVSLNV